jgi:hypothetical protein
MRTAIAIFALASASAWAGGWASSGGGSFKDQHNPWFVRNTAAVSYCVSIDSDTFSASADRVHSAVRTAIAYWKSEFGKLQSMGSAGDFEVGTQTFTEAADCASADVRVLAGYGKLADNEVAFFRDANDATKDVTQYIGVSVRTDYDEVDLRAKGFVYISSDRGAHVYQNDGNLITEAWSKPNLLEYALIHEFGHVFGFPHTGASIMSEVFLERILDQHLTVGFQQAAIVPFLFPGGELDCGPFNDGGFFGAQLGTCVGLTLGGASSSPMEIPVYAHTQASGAAHVSLGTIRGVAPVMADLRSQPGIFLHLNPRQKVFTDEEAGFRPFMTGPRFVDFGATGNFVPASGGASKPVFLRFTSSSLTITALKLNKLGVVFSYESPVEIPINP